MRATAALAALIIGACQACNASATARAETETSPPIWATVATPFLFAAGFAAGLRTHVSYVHVRVPRIKTDDTAGLSHRYVGMLGATRTQRQPAAARALNGGSHSAQQQPPTGIDPPAAKSADGHLQQTLQMEHNRRSLGETSGSESGSVSVGGESERDAANLAVRGHYKGMVILREERERQLRHRDGSAATLQRDNQPLQHTASKYWKRTRRGG